MSSTRQYYPARERRLTLNPGILARHFGPLCACADFVFIAALGAGCGYLWHALTYAPGEGRELYIRFALLVAGIYVLIGLMTQAYDLPAHLSGHRKMRDVPRNWIAAFLMVLAAGFLLKNVEQFSRGSAVLLFSLGLSGLLMREIWMRHLLKRAIGQGKLNWRRVLLVGRRHDISNFLGRFRPSRRGIFIAGTVEIDAPIGSADGERRWSGEKLKEAVSAARFLAPDDIYVVAPWSQRELIDSALAELAVVPAAIHLAPENVLARYREPRIGGLSGLPTLELCRPPLSMTECIVKRGFDIAASAAGLILLAPLFALVAVAIRLDSPGPALFRQTRHGYNQKPFRILKFRSMSVMEDGPYLKAATRNDARITRVGHWLRRTNIDELPQLVNVLVGDMSLVGPRPHAMSHDMAYMARIIAYARRNNVKPGITGWAQVNGLRGGTEDIEHIRDRVAYDFWYLENWSLELDIQIIWRTLFSSRAYSNAY